MGLKRDDLNSKAILGSVNLKLYNFAYSYTLPALFSSDSDLLKWSPLFMAESITKLFYEMEAHSLEFIRWCEAPFKLC